jgi:aryl-phospho-beta-D-glucosidase BglC (GH1 family)
MITGWLHTNPGSTQVYMSNGVAVPLAGVDVDGLDFGTGNPSSSPDSCGKGWSISTTSFQQVPAWGFNSVRIPISWGNIEPTAPTLASNGTWIHHWNTQYLKELDTVVTQFSKTHIAVIFDFAQVDVSAAFQQAPEKTQGGECEGWGNPSWLYPSITNPTTSEDLTTALCNFFTDKSMVGSSAPLPIEAMESAESMLAARYAQNQTVVGIDMFNEPWFSSSCGFVSYEGNLLTSFYTKMGRAIDAANPHLLLIFEDATPGEMPNSTPIMSSLPSVPNTMYEFHIYAANWTAAQPYVKSFLSNARTWGTPVWMGEFDAFEAGCTGTNCHLDQNWQVDTQSLLTYCNSNGMNWAYFSYYSLGTSVQAVEPSSQILAVLLPEIPTS